MSSTRKPKTTKAKTAAKPKVTKNRPAVKTEQASADAPVTADAKPTKALSGLDAAALVLRDASEPMNAQDLVARIIERGLWKTGGKTPAATIYAAMIREIKAKGSSSRFLKSDRGRFAATG